VSSQWSKCSGLMSHHQVSLQHFFENVTEIMTPRKSKFCIYITFSQSDCFIAQNEWFWLAIITKNKYNKHSELSEVATKLNVYSRKYNFHCSFTANVQAESLSFCGKICTLAFAVVQLWKKPFRKAKAVEFEKKKVFPDNWCKQCGVDSYIQWQISHSNCKIGSNYCGEILWSFLDTKVAVAYIIFFSIWICHLHWASLEICETYILRSK